MQRQHTHRLASSVLVTVQGPYAVCGVYCPPGFRTTFPAV